MGTKNNPGDFDCYANADPDEPMFILLARDAQAPDLVDFWADFREENGEDAAKVQEARDCAENMRTWFNTNRAAMFAAPAAAAEDDKKKNPFDGPPLGGTYA